MKSQAEDGPLVLLHIGNNIIDPAQVTDCSLEGGCLRLSFRNGETIAVEYGSAIMARHAIALLAISKPLS